MLLFDVDVLAGMEMLVLFEDELFEEFVVVLGLFADGELFEGGDELFLELLDFVEEVYLFSAKFSLELFFLD